MMSNHEATDEVPVDRIIDEARQVIVGDWGLNCRYLAYTHSENPRYWPSLIEKMDAVYFAHYRERYMEHNQTTTQNDS